MFFAAGGASRARPVPGDSRWRVAAESWEETARRLEALGDTEGVTSALREAAAAWERAAAASRTGASRAAGSGGVAELEERRAHLEEMRKGWARAALSWGRSAEAHARGGETEAAQAARARAAAALREVEETEAEIQRIDQRLREIRATFLGREVSPGLALELAERWARAAREWEETAASWRKAGEKEAAERALREAEKIRRRIRDLAPGLSEEWIRARTHPVPPPPAPSPSPSVEYRVHVPEIPPPPRLPPRWRLDEEEKAALFAAEGWRKVAHSWRKTALARLSENRLTEARSAVSKQAEAAARALELEHGVRRTYAEREAMLSAMVSRVLGRAGEAPRPEAILEALDAETPWGDTLPPLPGEPLRMAGPPLPGRAARGDTERGLFDLRFGGPIPSSLSVSGRKLVEVNYSMTKFKKESPNRPGGNTQTNLDINQELAVDVLGVIGREDGDHLNVKIHFDDTQRGVNQVNNRTVLVEYDGVRHDYGWGSYEINGAFGDIPLSLPGTEFALYNKQLFGVRTDVNLRDLSLFGRTVDRVTILGIASQTKGQSASRVFNISGERQIQDIDDINFVRRTFYRIEPSSSRVPVSGVTVYRDDQNGANNDGTVSFTAEAFDAGGNATGMGHAGNWDVLAEGIDYTVRLSEGLLEMRGALGENDVLAVAYTAADGTEYAVGGARPPRLIKVSTDTTSQALAFFRSTHELRNRYVLASGSIRREDPERVIEVRDALGSVFPPGSDRTYLEIFGFDANGDDKVDEERIDFDFGLLIGADTDPFFEPGEPALSNPNLYDVESPDADDKKYTIHTEVASDQPAEVYVIGQPILAGSEIVTVDGQRAVRNADYFIEYEAGVITFINTSLLKEGGEIRVDYEFLPFGGKFERTLAGGRIEVEPREGYLLGFTALGDFSPDPDEAPRIFEGAPDENAIFDVNLAADLAPLMRWALGRGRFAQALRDRFSMNFATEYALSRRDPNTFGAAVVEDFEATEEQISLAMNQTSWKIASPPASTPNIPGPGANPGSFAARGRFSVADRSDFGHLSEGEVPPDETQESLRIDISYDAGDTWVALRQGVSRSGVDFSNVSLVEVYLSGADNLGVFLDVGVVSEDADADGVLDSEDVGLDGIPNTGDAGENNGVLNTGEDVGFTYNDGATTRAIGAGNGLLDSEDMDGDFILDERNDFFRFGDLNTDSRVERVHLVGADGSNWTLYRFPFEIGDPSSNAADSTVVKHVRLWFTDTTAAGGNFVVFSDQIVFRRSLFKGPDSVVLVPRNTQDDPNYATPGGLEKLVPPEATKEQALGFQWRLSPGESVVVVRDFLEPADVSDYNRLSFFLAGDARNEIVEVRLQSDEKNYFAVEIPVDFGANPPNPVSDPSDWRRFDVSIPRLREVTLGALLSRGDTMQTFASGGETIHVVGEFQAGRAPSLSNVRALAVVITNPAGASDTSGEFWLDDFFVEDPQLQQGTAFKAQATLTWGDLWSLSASFRDIDANFRGVGFINNPFASTFDRQDQVQRAVSGTFSPHKFLPASWRFSFPLSFSWSENTTSLDPERIEVALKSSLGTTRSTNRSLSTTLTWGDLPALALAFQEATSEVDLRNEDQASQSRTFTASTGWSHSWSRRLWKIPIGQSFSLSTSYSFQAYDFEQKNFAAALIDRFTDERTHNFGLTNTWRPFGFLSLTYSLSQTSRFRTTQTESDRFDGVASRSQRLRSDWRLPAKFGLSPTFSWGGSYNESFFNRTAGEKRKDVSLSADFNASTGLDFSEWASFLDFLTLRYSFSMQSSASYRDLDPSTPFVDLFGDYVRLKSLPVQMGEVSYAPTGLAGSRTAATTSVSHNWQGSVRTWDWLSTSYNASLVRTESASGGGPSITDAVNANLAMSMDYNRAFPRAWPRFQSAVFSLNLPYSWSENAASRSIGVSPAFSANLRVSEALGLVFGLTYNYRTNLPLNTGEKTRNRTISPSLSFTYDFGRSSEGKEIVVPITGRRIEFYRRIRLSGGLNASFTKEERGPTRTVEQRTAGLNLSLAYRVATGLELTGGLNGSFLDDRLEELQSRYTLGGSARLEWQF